jgi:hypothetical protein
MSRNSRKKAIYGKFPVSVHPATLPTARENPLAIGAVATLATIGVLFACHWIVSLVR